MRHERIWYPGSILWLMVMMACGGAGLEEGEPEPWQVGDEMPVITVTAGDDESVPVETEPTPPAIPNSVPEEMSCELEHATTRYYGYYWVEPRLLGLTPNGGMVVTPASSAMPATAVRVADGEDQSFETLSMPGLTAVNADWSMAIDRADWQRWVVRDLNDDRELAVLEPSEGQHIVTAALSDRYAGFLECGRERPLLKFLSLDGGDDWTVELDAEGRCYRYGGMAIRLAFTDDARYAVATTGASTLWSIDMETMQVRSVDTASTDDLYGPGIYDIAVRPGAHELATTGVDGLMRWSLPGLEPIGEPTEVGVWSVNEYTYAPPYEVSPVTWTPEGDELVYANVDGDIVVGDDRLLLEGIDVEPIHEWDETPNAPVGLSFDRHQRRLVVARYRGVEIYGCPGEPASQRSGLHIRRGPEATIDGQQARISIEVDGGGPIYGVQVSIDGERWGVHTEGDELVVWWPGRETVELVVVVDDGVSTARARARLSFAE